MQTAPLFDGHVAVVHRRRRQVRSAQLQRKTSCSIRIRDDDDREWNVGQRLGAVTHVEQTFADERRVVQPAQRPGRRFPFHLDVLLHPQQRRADERRLELALARADAGNREPVPEPQAFERDAAQQGARREYSSSRARHGRSVLRRRVDLNVASNEPTRLCVAARRRHADREEIIPAWFSAILDHDREIVRRPVALFLDPAPECRALAGEGGRRRARADRIDHQGRDTDAVIGRLRRLVVVFELAFDGMRRWICLDVEAEIGST